MGNSRKRPLEAYLSAWLKQTGPEPDVVLSSRVRLARNLCDLPFPRFAKPETLNEVRRLVEEATAGDSGRGRLAFVPLEKVPPLEKAALVERHLISPAHAEQGEGKAVVLSPDETVAIMVNEEDHLRIQVILAGLDLEQAWRLASEMDDYYAKRLSVAFSSRWGYLTACPTNVGTGLRASAMVHLPALALTNQLPRVVGAAAKLSLAVRGLFGEGTAAAGNIFQVSNQVTLGHSEEDIIRHLAAVTRQVIEQERAAREALLEQARLAVDDRVHRAYGILSNARRLDTQEAMQLLSDVRLGVDAGLIKKLELRTLNALSVAIRPALLQLIVGRELSAEERDVERATLIREAIGEAVMA
ncbi:MAG: protein arginine kinase [Bacillota bacterium]|nr:protein arginine kinase [Bacillota bacterium]